MTYAEYKEKFGIQDSKPAEQAEQPRRGRTPKQEQPVQAEQSAEQPVTSETPAERE